MLWVFNHGIVYFDSGDIIMLICNYIIHRYIHHGYKLYGHKESMSLLTRYILGGRASKMSTYSLRCTCAVQR